MLNVVLSVLSRSHAYGSSQGGLETVHTTQMNCDALRKDSALHKRVRLKGVRVFGHRLVIHLFGNWLPKGHQSVTRSSLVMLIPPLSLPFCFDLNPAERERGREGERERGREGERERVEEVEEGLGGPESDEVSVVLAMRHAAGGNNICVCVFETCSCLLFII